MSHNVRLVLTKTYRNSASGIQMTEAESFPFCCTCGTRHSRARLLLQHIAEAREQEPCQTSESQS